MSFRVVMSARKNNENDNEPPSLMQFWRQSDEKLVVNKSWTNVQESNNITTVVLCINQRRM